MGVDLVVDAFIMFQLFTPSFSLFNSLFLVILMNKVLLIVVERL